MPETARHIQPEVTPEGVPQISVDYGSDQMLSMGAATELTQEFLDGYNGLKAKKGDVKTPSVVVNIKASTAGSPLIRALFELYKTVRASSGEVVCVGYPSDYLPSLISTGLLDQPGFSIRRSVEEAIKQALASPLKP